jgi:dUTP pyrophosphatase
MTIKVINKSKHDLPKYQTELSAGMDLYANIDEPITLKPLERTLVKQVYSFHYQKVTKRR